MWLNTRAHRHAARHADSQSLSSPSSRPIFRKRTFSHLADRRSAPAQHAAWWVLPGEVRYPMSVVGALGSRTAAGAWTVRTAERFSTSSPPVPENSCNLLSTGAGQLRRSKLDATTSQRILMPWLFSCPVSSICTTRRSSRQNLSSSALTLALTVPTAQSTCSCCCTSCADVASARASTLASTAPMASSTSSSFARTVGHHRPVAIAHTASPPKTTPAAHTSALVEAREPRPKMPLRPMLVSRSSLAESSASSARCKAAP
mmetsp:Transcript_21862/g.55466  ORF Transcript_21862/g.55466 Transcript_21862/m.55466 type:complete len:260 (-) Transcript_21862:221-1000(-)